MYIRRFRLTDHTAVNRLLKNVLIPKCYEETIEAFVRQLSLESDLVLVAIENEQVVGVIIGTIDNHQGYYYRVVVDPQYRRKGIGRSLIRSLKERFVQRKVSRIFVCVDEHDEAVIPFYESMGYTEKDFTRSPLHLNIICG